MIKLTLNCNNTLKTLAVISILTLPSLGFSENELENTSILTTVNTPLPRTTEGSQALIGTWILSTPHNVPKTDTLVINGASTSADGAVSAAGIYVPENAESELRVICLDDNTLEYKCIANNAGGGFVTFFFTISGNTISSGFFGIGESIATAESVALDETFPITGYRLSSGAKVDDNGALTIPAVEYEGQFYRVVLEDQGGFKFGIKSVAPVK